MSGLGYSKIYLATGEIAESADRMLSIFTNSSDALSS